MAAPGSDSSQGENALGRDGFKLKPLRSGSFSWKSDLHPVLGLVGDFALIDKFQKPKYLKRYHKYIHPRRAKIRSDATSLMRYKNGKSKQARKARLDFSIFPANANFRMSAIPYMQPYIWKQIFPSPPCRG
jgi:hypothetical protein